MEIYLALYHPTIAVLLHNAQVRHYGSVTDRRILLKTEKSRSVTNESYICSINPLKPNGSICITCLDILKF
jgi:hypothetical protein